MTPARRLALFYTSVFLGAGVQLPFWPVWLASRGLGPGEIGALLAIGQWARLAANPLAGMLADRSADRRRVMAALALLGLAGYALCLPAHGFTALLLPSLAAALAGAAILPLGDAVALAAAAAGQLDYGRVRLWGTIAFILATLVGGHLLAGRGADIVLYLLLATGTLVLASAALLPPGAPPPRALGRGEIDPRAGWRSLATPRNLVVLAAATLIQASHAVYYGFGTLGWQRDGIGDGAIALLWAEGAAAEVALFYWGAPLVRRWGPAGLIALGGGAGLLRWTATAGVATLAPLLLIQPLHALTFGATHLGAMHYLAREVRPAQAATAQALYAAAVNGIGFGIAALAAGLLYGRVGSAAYLAMAAMAAAGMALALSGRRR